jgi:hypothetical protein
MIQIDAIITWLRTNTLGYQVGGAASYFLARDSSRLMQNQSAPVIVPTWYVMLGKFNIYETVPESYRQEYEEKLVIMAVLDNQSDRTGQSAQQQIYQVRQDLYSMILNYEYDPNTTTLQADFDTMFEMDRASYWHQFSFKAQGALDQSNGYIPNLDNLNIVDVQYNSEIETAVNPMAEDEFTNLNP